jgi:hypothetical protein
MQLDPDLAEDVRSELERGDSMLRASLEEMEERTEGLYSIPVSHKKSYPEKRQKAGLNGGTRQSTSKFGQRIISKARLKDVLKDLSGLSSEEKRRRCVSQSHYVVSRNLTYQRREQLP